MTEELVIILDRHLFEMSASATKLLYNPETRKARTKVSGGMAGGEWHEVKWKIEEAKYHLPWEIIDKAYFHIKTIRPGE